MTRGNPDHGTRARYSAGCRCAPCTTANRDYQRLRHSDDPARPALVHALPAWRHLRWLATRGVGKKAAARASGLDLSTIDRIARGIRTHIHASTLEAILTVVPDDALPKALVPADDTWRRIDELIAHGWTKRRIARELGSTARKPSIWLTRDRITAANARKVKDLHERVLLPTSAGRRAAAARRALDRQIGVAS